MLQASIRAIRPGASCGEIVSAAKKVAVEEGYGEYTYFGILGHGIGTDLHEPPVIGDRVAEGAEDIRLEPNMVLALEPGILVPGVGGGHLEHMVLVSDAGHETLTKTEFDSNLMS
jgi:Xaa-Pro aminopeptidase